MLYTIVILKIESIMLLVSGDQVPVADGHGGHCTPVEGVQVPFELVLRVYVELLIAQPALSVLVQAHLTHEVPQSGELLALNIIIYSNVNN